MVLKTKKKGGGRVSYTFQSFPSSLTFYFPDNSVKMFHFHIEILSQIGPFCSEMLLYVLSTDQCPAGKFSPDGLGPLCRVCPKNTYQDQPGKSACKNCEHGTETLQLAATAAEACGGNLTT